MKNGPAKLLYAVGVRDLEALKCKEHEQADTGIFAHIGFSAKEQSCRGAQIFYFLVSTTLQ